MKIHIGTLYQRIARLDLIVLTEKNHSNSSRLLSGFFNRNGVKYDLKMRGENANSFLRKPLQEKLKFFLTKFNDGQAVFPMPDHEQ